MKKLLLILILLSGIAKAQTFSINIYNSNADTVHIGDSCFIDISYPSGESGPAYDSAWMSIEISGNLNIVAHYQFAYLDTVPKVSSIHGMLARLHFIMPHGVQMGLVNYLASYPSGSCTYPVFILDTTSTAGIETYTLPKIIKENIYYNTIGQQIQKPNESTNGLVIIRTLYTDGSMQVRKKYFVAKY